MYLGIVRLSEVKGDAQTGPLRQRESIMSKAVSLGADRDDIQWAEDLDVSAFHVPPMKRPALARALKALPAGSTVIVYRVDRVVRRVFPDWSDMVRYCADNGHTLVSATEPIDLSGALGQMVATNLAFIGQLESENTSARVKNTQAHFRQVGRWKGSLVPYGYRPVRVDGKAGLYLELDESADVLRDIVGRVLGGWSVNQAAVWLTTEGVLPPIDRARLLHGKPRLCLCGHDQHDGQCDLTHKCHHRKRVDGKNRKLHEYDECSAPCPAYRPRTWVRESLQEIMRSPALMGFTVEHDQVLLNDDGKPVRFADPGVIDQGTFDALQRQLDARTYKKVRTQSESLLLGVAFCDCGVPLYSATKVKRLKTGEEKTYEYYRPRMGGHCDSRMITAVVLDQLVERELLAQIGGCKVLRREVAKDTGRNQELAQVGRQISELTQDQYVRNRPRADFADQMARLQARHAKLSDMPKTTPPDKLVPTGQTFRARWESLGTLDRRLWLLNAGVRLTAVRGRMPSQDLLAGPLTAGEIPRTVIIDQGDVHAVIELGGLADLLERASAA